MTRRKVARPMFRISAPPLVNDWLLSRIAGFAALHPDIRIELLTSGRRRSAAANVSIMPLTAANLRDGAKLLSEIRITPICSPGFLAAHPVRTARDLLDLPLLDTIPSPKGWNEWFAAAGVSDELPSPFLAFDNHAQLYHAAVQGLGLALAMRSITAGQVAEGLLVEPIALDCEFRPHLGILVNEAANARLGRAFARWAEEALG